MLAIKAKCDGRKIILPKSRRHPPPGEVIVVFTKTEENAEQNAWLKAQEAAFAQAWDNDGDAIYDDL